MAGNVFEWTNDWKCFYDGSPITNCIGALQPDNDYEKVIKGGSFKHGFTFLRPSFRSATYATTLSSVVEYVGFRCVRGKIDLGQYIGNNQSNMVTNPVVVTATGETIQSFTGAQQSKLVFVNVSRQNRILCYVDFSKTFITVHQYLDDTMVYCPTISPDGRYVVYCTKNEGFSGPSKVIIRSLDSLGSQRFVLPADSAYIPRWWINRQTGDTCIVYTNSAIINSSPLWKSTKTFLQTMHGEKVEVPPIELVSQGSFHDGISSDGRFIVTAYPNLVRKDLITGEEMQLFVYPNNGKSESGSTQVCNASISPDTGSRVHCMFLDFGSQSSTIVGNGYEIHEYLFIANMNDSIETAIRCPNGESSWDNPEWTNQGRFAVATCRNTSEQSHGIYIIDINNHVWQMIATGCEMQQPGLWMGKIINNAFAFALDRLGKYYDPPATSFQMDLASKMLMFWKKYDSLNVIVTGSSQANWGINTQLFKGVNSLNLASRLCDLSGQKHLILNYILPHCSKLQVICSSLDPGWLGNADGEISWNGGVGKSNGFIYDSIHAFWSDSEIPNGFRQIIDQVPVPAPWDTFNQGYCGQFPLGWGDSFPDCNWSTSWTVNDQNFKQNLATIKMISDILKLKQLHWIVINFPVSPYYKNTQAYSGWGPSWQTAHDVFQKLREIEANNQFFHFYDANNDGNNDYGFDNGFDSNHLSSLGAEKLTPRVDSLIQTILQKK